MSVKRRNSIAIQNLTFNDNAMGLKAINAGDSFDMSQIGTVPATAIYVGMHMPVRIVNTGAAAIYFKTGAVAVVAPTGLTDGIIVRANTELMTNTGVDSYLIFDGAHADAQYAVVKDDGSKED